MNPVKNLQQIIETALGLVYPVNCSISGRPLDSSNGLWVDEKELTGVVRVTSPVCLRCGKPYQGAMSNPRQCANCAKLDLHFDSARAYAKTEGVVRELIHKFKYGEQLWLRNLLCKWMGEAYLYHYADYAFDGIVPVPIHPRKWRERGFNQAEILARALALEVKINYLSCLFRDKDTSTQTTFNRRKRFTNLKQTFKLSPKAKVRGLKLLLVDDVLTTGATASECAQLLKQGGATDVHVLTIARG
ncbi:MAG: phosphoribosyltransferase family protein [Verrucomicrobiota bacterium]|nr:phosphoribosyltransferase family protein [Verrucomicrobiota bacterium]